MKRLVSTNLKQFLNIFLVCPVFLFSQNQLLTDNLSILNQLTSNIVDSVFARLKPDSSDTVLIRSLIKEDQSNWIVENEFVKKLMQSGTGIQLNESANSVNNCIIEFKIIRFGVNYLPTSEKKLLERKLVVSLDIRTLSGQNRKINFFKNFTEQFVDSVRIKDIPKIELQRYPFTQAKIPMNRGLKKYIEPFIVMSTTAGIIYLFFRLRSK